MIEEPPIQDDRPFSVRSGRALSALLLFAWPFVLIAAVTTLREAPEGPVRACVASGLGLFLCTGAVYPLLFGLTATVSLRALRVRLVPLAAAAAWAPATLFVLLALLAGLPRILIPD